MAYGEFSTKKKLSSHACLTPPPQRKGYHSEAMSAGKADALHTLLERLLENTPGTFIILMQ